MPRPIRKWPVTPLITPSIIASTLRHKLDYIERWMDCKTIRDALTESKRWQSKYKVATLPKELPLSKDESTLIRHRAYIEILRPLALLCRELLGLKPGEDAENDDLNALARLIECSGRRKEPRGGWHIHPPSLAGVQGVVSSTKTKTEDSKARNRLERSSTGTSSPSANRTATATAAGASPANSTRRPLPLSSPGPKISTPTVTPRKTIETKSATRTTSTSKEQLSTPTRVAHVHYGSGYARLNVIWRDAPNFPTPEITCINATVDFLTKWDEFKVKIDTEFGEQMKQLNAVITVPLNKSSFDTVLETALIFGTTVVDVYASGNTTTTVYPPVELERESILWQSPINSSPRTESRTSTLKSLSNDDLLSELGRRHILPKIHQRSTDGSVAGLYPDEIIERAIKKLKFLDILTREDPVASPTTQGHAPELKFSPGKSTHSLFPDLSSEHDSGNGSTPSTGVSLGEDASAPQPLKSPTKAEAVPPTFPSDIDENILVISRTPSPPSDHNGNSVHSDPITEVQDAALPDEGEHGNADPELVPARRLDSPQPSIKAHDQNIVKPADRLHRPSALHFSETNELIDLESRLDTGESMEIPKTPFHIPTPRPGSSMSPLSTGSVLITSPLPMDGLPNPNIGYEIQPDKGRIAAYDFGKLGVSEAANDGDEDTEKQAMVDGEESGSARFDILQTLVEDLAFQRENVQESYSRLELHPDKEIGPPLMKSVALQTHQVIGVNWMLEMEDSLAGGGLLADDCGTGKTMSTLALICYKVDQYEKMIASGNPPGWDNYLQKKVEWGMVHKGREPRPPKWEVLRPTIIFCPNSMTSQWKEDIVRFTYLSPFLHYGETHLDHVTYTAIMNNPKPWRQVFITSPETFRMRYKPRIAGQYQFWGPGLVERVVIDEAHRLRTSGLGAGVFTSHTGGVMKITETNFPEEIATMILSLKPKYTWALSATPLVDSLRNARWYLRFLQKETWLTENVPPNTFASRVSVENGTWQAWEEGMPEADKNTPATDKDSVFVPGANPYNYLQGAQESLVHCSTKAWDYFVGPHLEKCDAIARRRAGHGEPVDSNDLAELTDLQNFCARYVYQILVRLTLRRTMTSHIPFDSSKPIIEIPPMYIKTLRVSWPQDPEGEPLEARELYKEIFETPYPTLLKCITSRPLQIKATGNPFNQRWRLLSLCALSPLAAVVAFAINEHTNGSSISEAKPQRKPSSRLPSQLEIDPFAPFASPLAQFHSTVLWKLENGKVDHGKPDIDRLRLMMKLFRDSFPDVAEAVIPTMQSRISAMNPEQIEQALRYGAPKLSYIKERLKILRPQKRDAKSKIVIWTYWPLSQWIVEQYCRLLGYKSFAIHSSLSLVERDKLRYEFSNPGGATLLVLSYLSSNEGLNLHPQCSNTIIVEQGRDYAMEHQAWSRVRRIGQDAIQYTERLVNPETIDILTEHAQNAKISPVVYATNEVKRSNHSDKENDMNQVPLWDVLIGMRDNVVMADYCLGNEEKKENGDEKVEERYWDERKGVKEQEKGLFSKKWKHGEGGQKNENENNEEDILSEGRKARERGGENQEEKEEGKDEGKEKEDEEEDEGKEEEEEEEEEREEEGKDNSSDVGDLDG